MTNYDRTRSHLDDRLVQACRSIAAETDAPPPEVISGAVAAFSWRTFDVELADLLDSGRELCIRQPLGRS